MSNNIVIGREQKTTKDTFNSPTQDKTCVSTIEKNDFSNKKI